MSEPDTVIMAQLEVKGCAAELYLNGVPLIRLTPETMGGENRAVQQWLTRGDNTVELLVEPGPTPREARTARREIEKKEMSAVARLIKFKEGADGSAASGTVLAEALFDWHAERPGAPPWPARMTFPHSASASTTLGSAFGPWAWESYPAMVLDDALVAEARALLDELDTAVRGGHADRIWQLTELSMRDTIKAYPALNEGFLRADITEMLQVFGASGDPTSPRDPAKQNFRLVGHGRLLELVDEDFRPSFQLVDKKRGQVVPFPTYVARVGKELRIVR